MPADPTASNDTITITSDFKRRLLQRLRDCVRYYGIIATLLERDYANQPGAAERLVAMRMAKADAEMMIEYFTTGKVSSTPEEKS